MVCGRTWRLVGLDDSVPDGAAVAEPKTGNGAIVNLEGTGGVIIATGFGFLNREAAFEIGESLIEYSPSDHSVAKRTLYTASFLFSFRDRVSNGEILTNPLGLTITYFREDEAFIR